MSGIKTIYHRIILGLSSADCLTSLAIALTTIPMPKDVIYPFEMPSYGTIATCEAQGLVSMMGNAFVFCMNGILNIYYLCTLRYNMTEKTFRCYLEIPLFVAAFVLSVTVPSTTLLNQELLNPSPTAASCVPNTYPLNCTKADNPECRGGGGRGAFAPLFYCTITLGFFTLMLTMALIVHSFYENARSLRKALQNKPSQEVDAKYEALIRAQETSSIVGRQALMYIAAFFITWIFGFAEFVWEATGNDVTELLSALTMIFQPLQGFFNLIIFVHHKVQTLRRADDDLTVAEALEIVFLFPSRMEDRATVSNLNIVIDQFVVDQQLVFENRRAAAMNPYDRRVDSEDSVVVGRGNFDDSDVATMSGSRGVVEAEASSDNISPLEPVAGRAWSSKVSSSQQSKHSGMSYAASSATSIFITGFKGPSAAATQSRIYNESTNNVTSAKPDIAAAVVGMSR
jgi:hypothetical protein